MVQQVCSVLSIQYLQTIIQETCDIPKMTQENYVLLNNGRKMPKIGLGTYRGQDDDMRKSVRAALECGYRSIDTAYLYMNEEAIGDELQDWFKGGKLKREDVFVTSKLPSIGNRRDDVSRFLMMSLKKLKLDYLDLYLVHHPFGFKALDDNNVLAKDSNGDSVLDFDTDHELLWKGMEEQVEAGRVKAIGVSNFNSSQIDRIMKIAKIPPAVHQIEVHGYLQQRPLVEKCKALGIAVAAYSPLGAPYTKEGENISPVLLEHPTVLEVGKRHGKTSAQILLKFFLQQDLIVIPKSVTPERIKSNLDVSGFHLSEEDMKSLASLDRGEEARVYHFKEFFRGCEKHKEYPF